MQSNTRLRKSVLAVCERWIERGLDGTQTDQLSLGDYGNLN